MDAHQTLLNERRQAAIDSLWARDVQSAHDAATAQPSLVPAQQRQDRHGQRLVAVYLFRKDFRQPLDTRTPPRRHLRFEIGKFVASAHISPSPRNSSR
jgi:hypothetical protein